MTKLLSCAIGLLLLTCGVVEAGDKHKPGDTWPAGDGCNTCSIDEYGNGSCTLLFCKKDLSVDIGDIIAPTLCESRMKEAMKEADDFMQGRSGLAIYKDPSNGVGYTWKPHDDVKRRWDSVMKECVQ